MPCPQLASYFGHCGLFLVRQQWSFPLFLVLRTHRFWDVWRKEHSLPLTTVTDLTSHAAGVQSSHTAMYVVNASCTDSQQKNRLLFNGYRLSYRCTTTSQSSFSSTPVCCSFSIGKNLIYDLEIKAQLQSGELEKGAWTWLLWLTMKDGGSV